MRYGNFTTYNDFAKTMTNKADRYIIIAELYDLNPTLFISSLWDSFKDILDFEEGDIVTFAKECTDDYTYSSYTDWVKRNVTDVEEMIKFAYGESIPADKAKGKFKILHIAPHNDEYNCNGTILCYVKSLDDDFDDKNYLVDIKALKKIEKKGEKTK